MHKVELKQKFVENYIQNELWLKKLKGAKVLKHKNVCLDNLMRLYNKEKRLLFRNQITYVIKKFHYILTTTCDGIVTKCHKTYRTRLGVDKHTEAYIQSLTLKKTLESITLDMWSNDDDDDLRYSREERVEGALKLVLAKDNMEEEDEVMVESKL